MRVLALETDGAKQAQVDAVVEHRPPVVREVGGRLVAQIVAAADRDAILALGPGAWLVEALGIANQLERGGGENFGVDHTPAGVSTTVRKLLSRG